MRKLTPLRNQIVIAIFLITISTAGCAGTHQKINTELLEQSKGKTFKLGIVKAVGDEREFRQLGVNANDTETAEATTHELVNVAANKITEKLVGLRFFSTDFLSLYSGYIAKAVDNIPTAEICSLLSSLYSINIDANVDRTVRVDDEERIERACVQRGNSRDNNCEWRDITITSFYAEYGDSSSEKEFPDVVNIIYSIGSGIAGFYYDIDVISSGQEVVSLHGTVESFHTTSLDSYVYYAGRINEALKRDLEEASQGSLSKMIAAIKAGDSSGASDVFKKDLRPF